MRVRILSRALTVLAATLIATTSLVAVSSPAQAYTCSGGVSATLVHRDGVATSNVNFYPECSDGRAHWNGTITDTLCDARAARVALMSPWVPIPGAPAFEWGHTNPNGCRTSSSFSGSNSSLKAYAIDMWNGACGYWSCAEWDMKRIYP